MRLLAVRNDRLGDLMLTWPALQTLHCNLPDAQLTVLAAAYTAPLARCCEGVNDVLTDPGVRGDLRSAIAMAKVIGRSRFDASVSFFSRFDSALALALAGVPMRAAPATKLAQVFYTHRLRQRRSRSARPEFVYNLELAEYALRVLGIGNPRRAPPPYLRLDADAVAGARRALCAELGLPEHGRIVFVHPGHGGSAPPPPARLLARIGAALADAGATIVLSEGPADAARVAEVAAALGDVPHAVYRSRAGLVQYALRLACGELFVSGSTGPLHIAGALNLCTAAFYPSRRSGSSLRWQTLNEAGRRLAYSPPAGAAEYDYGAIDADRVVAEVTSLFRAGPDRGRAATGRHT